MSEPQPVRNRRPEDGAAPKPIYAVWELTMKCDQPCQHCGSRAGPRARRRALHGRGDPRRRRRASSTSAAARSRSSAARPTCGPISRDRDRVPRRAAASASSMQTGGRAFTPRARAYARDGGPHRARRVGRRARARPRRAARQRRQPRGGPPRARRRARGRARHLCQHPDQPAQLPPPPRDSRGELRAHGIEAWQVQLTVPMGRAADRPEWILEPWQRRRRHRHARRDPARGGARGDGEGERPSSTSSPGTTSATSARTSRSCARARAATRGALARVQRRHRRASASSPTATVKGCPSLPTAPYVGGNVRDLSLASRSGSSAEVIGFARDRSADELWGFCTTCYYADVCRGGCSWTAHCTLGRQRQQPLLLPPRDRAQTRGVRERLVAKERAPQRALRLRPARDRRRAVGRRARPDDERASAGATPTDRRMNNSLRGPRPLVAIAARRRAFDDFGRSRRRALMSKARVVSLGT